MTWLYHGQEIDEDALEGYVSFVYRIVNLSDGRFYIGKKALKKTRTKVIKGRRRKVKSDSDWKIYFGSNKELLDDVELLGEQNFSREILHLCKSKGAANYLELKEQILHAALEADNSYNQWIMVRVHRSHLQTMK